MGFVLRSIGHQNLLGRDGVITAFDRGFRVYLTQF